jgi:hypothetical protein
MQRFVKDPIQVRADRRAFLRRICREDWKCVSILVLAGTLMLSACGGSSGNSNNSQSSGSISGNWQFYMDNPLDSSGTAPFVGGLQGGFLLGKNGSLNGGVVYSVALPPNPNAPNGTPCNTGSAAMTGTISGQTVNLTAVAGTQTFTLTGTLSSDGKTIDSGTYTSTDGTAPDGTPCGIATTATNWRAVAVPPLTGAVMGSFHSTTGVLNNQVFPVTGTLTQGENIGASNATVTGTLSFINPASLLSDYPCLDTASVNGQISGNTVILQLIGLNGLNVGQIGVAPSQINIGGNGAFPVTFDSTQKGYILHSVGTGYVVNTKACLTDANSNKEDVGDICLAVGGTSACQQPITLSPGFLLFPAQALGSTPTTQTVTLTNNSGSDLSGVSLTWSAESGLRSETGQTSFTGMPNFTEADTGQGDPCAAPLGSTFALSAGQSCTIAVSFSPQESCTWLPAGDGTVPSKCPLTLIATLAVSSPVSADNDTTFVVPITGSGLSAVTASTSELDFGSEGPSQASLPQVLSFTNHSANPVQILAAAPCTSTRFGEVHHLPHPLVYGDPVAGLQVVNNLTQDTTESTIMYTCDWDTTSNPPNSNFKMSSDTCSGTLLEPQTTCSLEITFVPQAAYFTSSGLDEFLELNTVQCVNGAPNCEIDGGRFPVEIIVNPPSPLRMLPAAGIDFGGVPVGKKSVVQQITVFNDPSDPASATVTLISKPLVSGDYSESDDCPFSLAPGASCTLTITFKPKTTGPDPGAVKLDYTTALTVGAQVQTVNLHGVGQQPPPPGPQAVAGKASR